MELAEQSSIPTDRLSAPPAFPEETPHRKHTLRWTMVENEERSVGNTYMSTGIFASVQDSTTTKLQRNTSRSQAVPRRVSPLVGWRHRLPHNRDCRLTATVTAFESRGR